MSKRYQRLPAHISPKARPTVKDPSAFSAAAVNMAREPSLPDMTKPTIDGLTGMEWCRKHGLKFQFDLPAIRVFDQDKKLLGMSYNANGPQGLIDAIKVAKKNPLFSDTIKETTSRDQTG